MGSSRTCPSRMRRTGFLVVLLALILFPAGMASAGDDAYTLELRALSFDPLAKEAALPAELRTGLARTPGAAEQAAPGRFIVQFTRSLTRAERTRLQNDLGLRLDQYIPHFAYLETLDPRVQKRLGEEELVRAVVPYLAAFKVDPEIAQRARTQKDVAGAPGLRVLVLPFPGTDADALARAVEALGFKVLAQATEPDGRSFQLVVQLSTPEDAQRLAALEAVRFVEAQGRITLNNGTATGIVQSDVVGSRPVWDHGLHGEGQIIGHIDGLIDMNHCFFRDPVDNTPGPLHRKVVGYRDVTHHVSSVAPFHGTLTAATAAGKDINDTAASTNANNGHAPGARLSYANLKDLTGSDPPGPLTFYTALVEAFDDGATIHNNSWDDKDTHDYTQLSRDLDRFAWEHEDSLVLVAPENDTATGNGEIHPPVNALNSLTVNAFDRNTVINQDVYYKGTTQFTLDGRRKPEVLAPGKDIVSAVDGTNCTTASSTPTSTGTARHSGTSLATPAISGAAALVRQYYTEGWYPSGSQQPHHAFTPSGALLKATLVNGTRRLGLPYPGAEQAGTGWGKVVLDDSLYFAGDTRNTRVWDVRHGAGLATGESRTVTLPVAGGTEQLKITLVWTEPPPDPAAATPVTNDLNLVVTDPAGSSTFLGNNFSIGGTSQTGGTADALNNIEMVIVDNPAAGVWTLTVSGAAVNTGAPGQGYALVATGDFPEPPSPLGDQNTLVVRVRFPDIAGDPPAADLLTLMGDVATYFQAASYSQVTILPELYPNVVTLAHARSYYEDPARSFLVELAQEVIAALGAAPFAGPTAGAADDIDRLLIVTNANDPGTAFGAGEAITGDAATTGPWPYDLPAGLTRPISVSILPFDSPLVRFTHSMGHQLGLVDLGPHPGLEFAQPHVDAWDQMAAPLTGSDFLSWSKTRPGWMPSGSVQYIPRPAAGGSASPAPIPLNFLGDASGTRAIAIGLTEGASSLAQENVFYWIEARSKDDGGLDGGMVPGTGVPETGVLLYKVDEGIPQGGGPVRIIDQNLPTNDLDDAAYGIDQTANRPDAGLTMTVRSGTASADRRIELVYDPPETDNDVYIEVGDPFYTSPDIWIDSPVGGFDVDNGVTPMDHEEQPEAGVVNHVYVRIHNRGPDTAYDFTIYVRASEPYHTVGGEADFDDFIGEIYVPSLAANDTLVSFLEWTPADDGHPHACLQVEVPSVFNDVNLHNNRAQQNLEKTFSSHGSPYDVVTFPFALTSSEDAKQLFYFRAQDVPAGWSSNLVPTSAYLAPGEEIAGSLTLHPPDDAPACTTHRIRVTSWMPRGDTLIPVGGSVVQVDLRNRTKLTLATDTGRCDDATPKAVAVVTQQPCRRISVSGCTQPPRPFEEIIVKYQHPDGYPIYRTVTTDAAGCFSDFLDVPDGDVWTVSAEYPGSDCSGGAQTPRVPVKVGLPSGGDADGDGLDDRLEPQGDRDGDGIPGLYDPDSDNDGVPDGREPAGDCDRDGVPNVVDQDSDNDGIIDGRDSTPCGKPDSHGRLPTRPGRTYSFHVGSTHPLGNLDEVADANIYLAVDLTYPFKDRLSLQGLLGLAQLTAESDAGIDHPRWLHGSLDLRWSPRPTASGLRPYLRGGPGIYWPKSGSADLGFNFGLGAQIPLTAPFALEFGTDFHQVIDDGKDRFVTFQLGVQFR